MQFIKWWINKAIVFVSYFIGSAIGFIISIYLYTSIAQNALCNFHGLHIIFLTIGGMIGTILALVFSLSIIPIQRASEVFTSSIIELYRNDRVTVFIFFTLILFCITSFVIGIEGIIHINVEKLFPLEILMIACSFDLLRWYFRHISKLLEPNIAVKKLSKKTITYISKLQHNISRLAKIQYNIFSHEEKKERSKENYETALYALQSYHSEHLAYWVGEIAEIIHKAIGRGETLSTNIGINTVSHIAQHYLNCRKDNIIMIPSPEALFLASGNDASPVLSNIYEHLQNINRNSIAVKNETISIQVLKAYENLSVFTANLKGKNFLNHTAPLTFTPLFYFRECVKASLENQMYEAALQSSSSLLKIGINSPIDVSLTDIHSSLLDTWYEITQQIIISEKGALANSVLNDLMKLNNYLLIQRYPQFVDFFRSTLEKLETFSMLAVANEKIRGSSRLGLLLSPYDLINSYSIGYLIGSASEQINKENDKPHINPYQKFIDINEIGFRHFRNLAENIDFGNSFLLWHITQTIKHIAYVYLFLIRKKDTYLKNHKDDLVHQIPWYLAFFWVVFNKKSAINYQFAEHACDTMSWIGLSFYLEEYPKISENCISNICSIIESYSEPKHSHDPYNMADLFIFLWEFHLLAEIKENQTLMTIVNTKINTKPKALSDAQWNEVKSIFELRKQQLDERLHRRDYYYSKEDSLSLLRQIVNKE